MMHASKKCIIDRSAYCKPHTERALNGRIYPTDHYSILVNNFHGGLPFWQRFDIIMLNATEKCRHSVLMNTESPEFIKKRVWI